MDVEDNEGKDESFYRYVREELLKEIGPGTVILLVYPAGPAKFRVDEVYHRDRYFRGRAMGKGKLLNERRVEFEEFIDYGTILLGGEE